MTADPSADARSILDTLQAAVDARDAEALVSLDPVALIGTAGDGRSPDAVRWERRAPCADPNDHLRRPDAGRLASSTVPRINPVRFLTCARRQSTYINAK